jgi:hypothetical protein
MNKNNYTELTEKQELMFAGIIAILLFTIIIVDYINVFTN